MSADTSLDAHSRARRSRARAARGDRRAPTAGSSWSACRRTQIRAALEAAGLEPEAGQASRQADLALDLQSRGQRLRGDERHRQGAARRGSPSASSSRGPKWSRRRCRPTARANGCCDPRRPRFRDGVHPRRRPRHLVRVEPGRLHAQLPLLPHRHDAAGAQPRAGGDRRPGDARPRRARRMAVASPKGGC